MNETCAGNGGKGSEKNMMAPFLRSYSIIMMQNFDLLAKKCLTSMVNTHNPAPPVTKLRGSPVCLYPEAKFGVSFQLPGAVAGIQLFLLSFSLAFPSGLFVGNPSSFSIHDFLA